LASLGKLNQLKELAEEGRSKGVCLSVGFQSIKSIENAYNEKVAKAIMGQFQNKAFLKLNEAETAEWASKLIGTAEIIEPTRSTTFSKDGKSYTTGEIRKIINTVEPSQLLSIAPINKKLSQGLTGYYLVGHGLYSYTYSIDFITQNLLPKSSEVEDFIPAPDSYQKLEDWTDEDLHRLGIYHILNPELETMDE
jgi:hypothetical protein